MRAIIHVEPRCSLVSLAAFVGCLCVASVAGEHVSAATPASLTSYTVSTTTPTVGSPVVYTASATGGTGTYEYRFDLYDADHGSWTLLQSYAANASVTWTPSAGGTYWVQVWVRAAGSSSAWEDWRNSDVVTVNAPALTPTSLSTFTTSRTATTVASPVVFTASATGGTGAAEYRFDLYNSGTASWTLLQNYSTNASISWTPAATGTYWVQVWVRTVGSSSAWDDWRNSDVVMVSGTSPPVTLTTFSVSRTATSVQSPVVFTAAATGGTGAYEFRFDLYDAGHVSWTLLQDYAPNASVTWTPTAAGTYWVQVWVRAVGSSAPWEDWRNSDVVTVSGTAPPVTLTTFSVSPTATSVQGPVVFTAAAAGGTGAYEYRFDLYDAGHVSWTLLQDYAPNASVTWTPPTAGTYWVQVWVRAVGSSAAWEDWRNSDAVTVSPPPVTISTYTTSPTDTTVQRQVAFTATAAGGTGVYEYRFDLYDAGHISWTLLQEYAPNASVTWTPTAAGTYWVQVWVRAVGSTSAWEDWRNSDVVTVSSPAWAVVRTVTGSNVLSWNEVPGVDRYLVLESTDRATLVGSPSTAGAVEVPAPPYTSPTAASATPHYFRVFPVFEDTIGPGGPIAASTAVSAHAVPTPAPPSNGSPGAYELGEFTPALWDRNGDGCLDMVGRLGACDGTFAAAPLDPLGEGLLFAAGRVNRDSRFADFTGDGIVDIFTNVYSPANDPASQAVLLVGRADGTFRPDAGVASLGLGGFGETVVAADIDNDGDLDLYLPHYFDRLDGGHSWLLINDGHGVFHDVSLSAGVSSTAPFNPEGAQALDFNQDGWIDIAVATHLYINNGNLTFTDQAASVDLPAVFDEGMLLFDADLDGDLDLVHHDGAITRLHRNVNDHFDSGTDLSGAYGQNVGYGMNVCDVNGDGYQDILVAHNTADGSSGGPRLLLNGGGSFAVSDLTTLPTNYVDLIACADLDNNGLPDVVTRGAFTGGNFQSQVNTGSSATALRIRVLGANGERSQQGRAVRVRPTAGSGQTIIRFVESGSAYMAQNGYDQVIGLPWTGDVEVSVLFGTGWVTTTTQAGSALTFYADGTIATGLN